MGKRVATVSTIVAYIDQLVRSLTSLALSVFLARTLIQADFGIYKLVGSLTTFGAYAVSLGLEPTISRYTAEFQADNTEDKIASLLIAGVVLRGGCLGLLSIVLILFDNSIGAFFNAPALFTEYLLPTLAYIALTLLNRLYGSSLLVGLNRRDVAGYVSLTSNIGKLGILSTVAIISPTIPSIIWGLLGSAVLEALVSFIAATTLLPQGIKLLSSAGILKSRTAKRLARFGLFNWLWQGGQVFREFTVDNFVISHFLNPAAVGIYGVAAVFPHGLRSFSPGRLLHGVVLPRLTKAVSTDDPPYNNNVFIQRVFRFEVKIIFLLMFPGSLVASIWIPELIELAFGADYLPGTSAARILVLGGLFAVFADPYYAIIQAYEQPEYIFATTGFGILNLLGDILLVPLLGVLGAAVATSTVSILILIYFVLLMTRFDWGRQLKWPSASLMRMGGWLSLPVIASFILYLTKLGVVLGIVTTLIIYIVCVTRLLTTNKVFNSWEKEFIIEVLPSR